jgi:flagellar hook-associated protein 1
MGKIHSMMDIGKRTMMNSQSSLQTTAHNIANKTTEGYSRQRVDLVTAPPITEGNLQMGMGARAATVSRTNNPFLDKQLQIETGIMGFHQGQADSMSRVEQIFNEQNNKGLNQYITDFFNGFRELSNNPESQTSRVIVREAADAVAKDFKRVNTQLESAQKEVDVQVLQTITEINKMTKELASLNQKIAHIEIQGQTANDERDRRDVLIKNLNERIDVKVAEGDNGMVSVATAGNALLVSGLESIDLKTHFDMATKRNHVYFEPGSISFDITDRIKGGTLGGTLDIRDKFIPDVRSQMDRLAETFANEVNKVHTRGFDRSSRQGLEFFKFDKTAGGASAKITVNQDILDDINRIAAAAKPGAVGDNTVANVISMIQFHENMDGTTMDDFYNSQVGRVGVIAQRAVKAKESQGNILQQVNTLRESVSGVSLDEEATKMIEFQKAFDASARLIRTADEMFDTVLSLKRM